MWRETIPLVKWIRNGFTLQKVKPVPPPNSNESSKDKINVINESFNGSQPLKKSADYHTAKIQSNIKS